MTEGIYDIFLKEVLQVFEKSRHKIFYFKVLYERICIVIAVARRMKKRRNAQWSATNRAQLSRVIQTRVTETILTLKGIALCTVKFEI